MDDDVEEEEVVEEVVVVDGDDDDGVEVTVRCDRKYPSAMLPLPPRVTTT